MLFFLPFVLMKKILFVFLLCMIWQEGFSQYVYGTTGLLHMPTADMQPGVYYLVLSTEEGKSTKPFIVKR